MEGFCRGCLIKYNEPTELLQYTEKNRRLFVYCTGIQVKRNDTFSFQLCKECYLNMKVACKFKKLCRTSDKTFNNYIALKEDNNSIDFCTFLKNNDDALTVRFPVIPSNSTPANQASRDDDNESTCTSIRNFMTDMLQGEEMPDTESRIIREVIEEEADILDDSLDSYWLHDDISIDTDFRLDFNFSPFSTPRSVRNNNCFTPNKRADLKEKVDQEMNYYTSKGVKKEQAQIENNFINGGKNVMTFNNPDDKLDMDYLQLNNDMLEIEENINNQNILQGKHPQNLYVSNDNFQEPDQIEVKVGKGKVVKDIFGPKCTIDRNLEEALKNESNKEFCLDDLLVSPQVYPRDSAVSSPAISSILFGSKLDGGAINVISKNEVGQLIENFQDVGGIEDEIFLNKNELEMYSDEEEKDTTEKSDLFSIENKFDIDNSLCILCNKKFKNSKALRIHAVKTHKLKINNPNKNSYKYNLRICDICGKEFRDSTVFYRHKKRHKEDNTLFKCELCAMIFSSAAKLKMHMVSHTGNTVPKDTGKKYVCNICGALSNHYANFRIHKLRHTKAYSNTCEECGRGFFRSSDLTIHMRRHTGERPFTCEQCHRSYSRKSALVRHVKSHADEKQFQCDYCNRKFITKMMLKQHIKYSKACLMLRDSFEVRGTSDSANINVIYTVGSQDKINKKMRSLHKENGNHK